jgi:hypothetical protein
MPAQGMNVFLTFVTVEKVGAPWEQAAIVRPSVVIWGRSVILAVFVKFAALAYYLSSIKWHQ